MGATVSLNNPKSGRSGKVIRASITRTGGASGILRHRKRSERTEQVDGYWGKDRAMILRFINKGTIERVAFKEQDPSPDVRPIEGLFPPEDSLDVRWTGRRLPRSNIWPVNSMRE